MENKRIKLRKIFFTCVVVMFCLMLVGVVALFSVNAYVKAESGEKILTPLQAEELENVDCILVLGCGVNAQGQPSGMLEDRLQRGIELYEAGVSEKLLMSGDHGRINYNEVGTMKQYAIDCGVPSEDVFMDHAGFSTYESMYRAKEIFEAEKILIVTQEYHLYRAIYIAQQLGLDAYGVSSDLHTYAGQSSRDVREVLARCKDFVYTLLKPEPTYLGEAIPVNGDGNLTND